MNLHQVAKGLVGSVNKFQPVTIRISTGNAVGAGAKLQPQYATPGAITAAIAGGVLTVSAVASGAPQKGQGLADLTSALAAGTIITGQLSGAPGGIGTYSVNIAQTVASEAMTTALVAQAQIQPMTWRDLRQVDGLNLQGTLAKIFLSGQIEGIVRATSRGGDLVTFPDGSVWLVSQVLEGWHTAGWCAVAATLQNGS